MLTSDKVKDVTTRCTNSYSSVDKKTEKSGEKDPLFQERMNKHMQL